MNRVPDIGTWGHRAGAALLLLLLLLQRRGLSSHGVAESMTAHGQHDRRLRVLARTLGVGLARVPVAAATTVDLEAPAAAEEPPVLLDDAAVKRFLVDGMLALPLTDLPVGFHRELQRSSRAGYERLQAAGLEDRYVYNDLPAMSDVLASPMTRGALVSLLGPGYVQHPHRSMHVQGEIEDGMPRLGDGGWVRCCVHQRRAALLMSACLAC